VVVASVIDDDGLDGLIALFASATLIVCRHVHGGGGVCGRVGLRAGEAAAVAGGGAERQGEAEGERDGGALDRSQGCVSHSLSFRMKDA